MLPTTQTHQNQRTDTTKSDTQQYHVTDKIGAEDTVFGRIHPSPLGDLLVLANAVGVIGLYWPDHKGGRPSSYQDNPQHPILALACEQLDEYFAGTRQQFDVPLCPEGTPFQQKVWDFLQTIPYGETITYLEIAHALGDPGTVRAVGTANGKNPISLFIPCHRVVGANGKLVGYAGGIEQKKKLLALEKQYQVAQNPSKHWSFPLG